MSEPTIQYDWYIDERDGEFFVLLVTSNKPGEYQEWGPMPSRQIAAEMIAEVKAKVREEKILIEH